MKIISGGQTGADRAALDFAISHGIEHGGYCPNGRRAEDGPIPDQYRLVQTGSRNYLVRTEKNVAMSDGTVIFIRDDVPSTGSYMTSRYCEQHEKPYCIVGQIHDTKRDAEVLVDWITKISPKVLNFAGHRESSCPGIHDYVVSVLNLTKVLSPGLFT
jgi:hypothetical protein